MKKQVFVIIVMIFFTNLFAQKRLEVLGTAERIPNPIITVKDANNRTAAVLYVDTSITGLNFTTNTGLVKDTEISDLGEYILYLVPGEQFLRINHPQYTQHQVIFSDIGILGLESGTAWRIYLADPDDKNARIQINANVSKAEIYVGDNYKGIAPRTIVLSEGNYTITLKDVDNDFKDETKRISVKAFENEVHTFILKPKFSSLQLDSTPDKAEFVVMNTSHTFFNRGLTPAKLEKVPAGTYKLELTKTGFNTEKETITIGEGQNYSRFFRLNVSDEIEKKSIERSLSLHKTLRLISGVCAISSISYGAVQYISAIDNHKKYEDAKTYSDMEKHKTDRDDNYKQFLISSAASAVFSAFYYYEHHKVKSLSQKYDFAINYDYNKNIFKLALKF